MTQTNTATKPVRTVEEEGHVVKMWTPFNIKVDETYKYIPTSKLFKAFSLRLRRFANRVLRFFNKAKFGLVIEGQEKLEPLRDKGFITVCNHVNFLDCAMIANAAGRSDMTFTTIKENFEIPVVRHIIKALGAIPIPRTPKAMKKFNEAVGVILEQGHIVHFYPEGVLFPYYNGVREFRHGAFKYGAKFDKPIVPMVITYYKNGENKTPRAKITVLDPVYPDTNLTERECAKLLEKTAKTEMTEAFNKDDCLKDNTEVLKKYGQ